MAELAEGLHAEILCSAEHVGNLVENMMVGAMSAEAALMHFRRKPNKAVITGGDRADIQLAALETSTRCLILTGNLYPSPTVLNRADELGVPVLLADMDTLAAIEVVESYMGRSRVQLPQKIDPLFGHDDRKLRLRGLVHKPGSQEIIPVGGLGYWRTGKRRPPIPQNSSGWGTDPRARRAFSISRRVGRAA